MPRRLISLYFDDFRLLKTPSYEILAHYDRRAHNEAQCDKISEGVIVVEAAVDDFVVVYGFELVELFAAVSTQRCDLSLPPLYH